MSIIMFAIAKRVPSNKKNLKKTNTPVPGIINSSSNNHFLTFSNIYYRLRENIDRVKVE